jgi:DNA damage-binding protein 1
VQVVVMKNPDAATDEERHRLTTVGLFHTGESINRIVHGSLVMRLPDGELSGVPTVLYGSVDGAIGLVASLPKELYDLLAALQEEMRKVGGRSSSLQEDVGASQRGGGRCGGAWCKVDG